MLDLSGISRAPLVAARVGFAGLLFAIFLALALGQRVAVVDFEPVAQPSPSFVFSRSLRTSSLVVPLSPPTMDYAAVATNSRSEDVDTDRKRVRANVLMHTANFDISFILVFSLMLSN